MTVQQAETYLVERDSDAYAVFFLHSPRPQYVFDLSTYAILDANDAALELYGYTRDELLGMTILNLRSPEEIPRLLDYLQSGEPDTRTWRHRRRDGSVVEVEAAWSRFSYEGTPAQLVVFSDVTGREQAVRALEASEERFRTAVDTVLSGFMILSAVRDEEGRITDFAYDYVNDAVASSLGAPREYIVGRRTTELRARARVQAFLDRFTQVVESGVAVHDPTFENEVEVDGTTRTLVYDLGVAKMGDGVVVNYRDVTASAEAAAALRRSEERFRTVVESCALGILLVGPDFRVLEANPAVCLLLGFERQELRAKTFLDFTYGEDIETDAMLARRLFAGEIPRYSLEKRFVTKSGAIVWVKLDAAAVYDEDHHPVGSIRIVEDITARKDREHRARELAEDARRRLATLTQREREALDLGLEGLNARQIAERMTISARTAESHLAAVYRKLGVASREAALREYELMVSRANEPIATMPERPAVAP